MRTGTRTVRALSLMTSAPETICGRCLRTASRTFSSCRSQSRAPRENRSYHLASPRAPPSSLFAVISLLCQQSGDVAQCLLGAVLVVSVLLDETLLNHRNLLPGLFVR